MQCEFWKLKFLSFDSSLDPPLRTSRWRILHALRSEVVRLRTFDGRWTSSVISAEELAHAGFFYFQNEADEVQCPFCLNIAGRWTVGDTAVGEHARLFPRCPFVLGLPVGNIPIGTPPVFPRTLATDVIAEARAAAERTTRVTRSTSALDALVRGVQYGKTLLTRKRHLTDWLHVKEARLCELGTISTGLDGYVLWESEKAQLKDFHQRLRTFSKWPISTEISGVDMAAAGFFFTEVSDQVACLCCNVHLRGWKSIHNPLQEHISWKPGCSFVRSLSNLPTAHNFVRSKLEVAKKNQSKGEEEGSSDQGQVNFECKICFEKMCEFVILPCAHMCACLSCGLELRKCPMCRGSVETIVKVYI